MLHPWRSTRRKRDASARARAGRVGLLRLPFRESGHRARSVCPRRRCGKKGCGEDRHAPAGWRPPCAHTGARAHTRHNARTTNTRPKIIQLLKIKDPARREHVLAGCAAAGRKHSACEKGGAACQRAGVQQGVGRAPHAHMSRAGRGLPLLGQPQAICHALVLRHLMRLRDLFPPRTGTAKQRRAAAGRHRQGKHMHWCARREGDRQRRTCVPGGNDLAVSRDRTWPKGV